MNKTEVLRWRERRGTRRNIEGMARYAIVAKRVYGVSMSTMLSLQKKIGKDHALALELWETGWYEARLMAALIDDPKLVTRRQMNSWAAGFVLMACLALHDKTAPDAKFLPFLPMIEKGAHDQRNFVKKGVNWALRGIGRRNRALHAAAMKAAKRLALSKEASCRWVGKDALRELSGPVVRAKLAKSPGARTKG